MLRDGGLRDARQLREIAGAEFVVQQAGDDARAGGIAQRLEDGGEVTSGSLVEHARAAGRHAGMLHTSIVATGHLRCGVSSS